MPNFVAKLLWNDSNDIYEILYMFGSSESKSLDIFISLMENNVFRVSKCQYKTNSLIFVDIIEGRPYSGRLSAETNERDILTSFKIGL